MFYIGNVNKKTRMEILHDAEYQESLNYPEAEEYGIMITRDSNYSHFAESQLGRVYGTNNVPRITKSFMYNGEYQKPDLSDFWGLDSDKIDVEVDAIKAPGTHYVKYKTINPIRDKFINGLDSINKESTDYLYSTSLPTYLQWTIYPTYPWAIPTPFYVTHDGGVVTIDVPDEWLSYSNFSVSVTAAWTNSLSSNSNLQGWFSYACYRNKISISVDKTHTNYLPNNVGYLEVGISGYIKTDPDTGGKDYNPFFTSAKYFIFIVPNDVCVAQLAKNYDDDGYNYFNNITSSNYTNSDYYDTRREFRSTISQQGNINIPVAYNVSYTGKPMKPYQFAYYDTDYCTITAEEQTEPGLYFARCVLKHPEIDCFKDGVMNERLIPWRIIPVYPPMNIPFYVSPQTQDIKIEMPEGVTITNVSIGNAYSNTFSVTLDHDDPSIIHLIVTASEEQLAGWTENWISLTFASTNPHYVAPRTHDIRIMDKTVFGFRFLQEAEQGYERCRIRLLYGGE